MADRMRVVPFKTGFTIQDDQRHWFVTQKRLKTLPHIPEMPHRPCAYEAQQHVLVLLPLVLVHRRDLRGPSAQPVSVRL